jgi:epoxyqueuosine reductase
MIFPTAKSVIVCALNYFTPHDHSNDPEKGKISRYAWGDDYHNVVKEKLNALLAWIKTQRPDAEGKACVDTAPVMDKPGQSGPALGGSASIRI